mmetsp:Transcript_15963/g.30095  ORF Transcript_15963/g.30095 Transcript_15963/m.30095 type:complete len:769 (-) Transcript_15963:175-2481(-)
MTMQFTSTSRSRYSFMYSILVAVLVFKYMSSPHALGFSPNVPLGLKTRAATTAHDDVLESHLGVGSSLGLSFLTSRNVPSSSSRRFTKNVPSLLAVRRYFTRMHQKKDYHDEEDEDDEIDIDISDKDWRAFRAQLVMQDSTPSTTSSSSKGGSILQEEEGEEGEQTEVSSTAHSNNIDQEDLDGIGSLFITPQEGPTPMTRDNFTPLAPSQWAYDAGHVIEKGAVILGGVEQEFGFGLRQQYFHKVVCLVLEHDEKFTRGVILNRPTDMLLVDEYGTKWRIWFGGDVQNLNHPMPDIVCLHSLRGKDDHDGNEENSLVDEVSKTVMKDIQYCTFANAQLLVQKKQATPLDFWCFAGYAGWGPGQLMGELDRKSWYMCATDSQTLLKELAKQSALTDPRDAGLDTWELLMGMIGRGGTAEECSGDFADLMLKEWARENLLSVEAGGNAGIRLQPVEVATTNMSLVQQQGKKRGEEEGQGLASLRKLVGGVDSVSTTRQSLRSAGATKSVGVGSLLRASSQDRNPFLLKDQEFHKSIILIIADDGNASVGLILNKPSSRGLKMDLVDRKTGGKRQIEIPIRFGGQYAIRGQGAVIWLHNNDKLRKANVGKSAGPAEDGIWTCSQDDATAAISAGLAKPSDFLIVSGLSIWIKGQRGVSDGLQGEVKKGTFEIIDSDKIANVWDELRKQEILTKLNLIKNLESGYHAWKVGVEQRDDQAISVPMTSGIGEGFDEEDDNLVFKSDVKVSKLSDDAHRSWIATFLLGAPSLGA